MKDRASILCVRDSSILLVARDRSRWALPGGRIRRGEAPHEAALRELEKETTLRANELMYLFQFSGFNTVHNVFFADVAQHTTAQPTNEIAKCRWFAPIKIATLSASVPTRGIVELFFQHIGVLGPDDVRRPLQHVDRVAHSVTVISITDSTLHSPLRPTSFGRAGAVCRPAWHTWR